MEYVLVSSCSERQSGIAQAPLVWNIKSYSHPFVSISLTLGPPWPLARVPCLRINASGLDKRTLALLELELMIHFAKSMKAGP
jgi:hypothetical protein